MEVVYIGKFAGWGDVMEWKEFYEIAAGLSHDPVALRQGKMVEGQMRISNPEVGAGIVSRAEPWRREKRAQTFFDSIRSRQALGQGMHDRGEAISFAYGRMKPGDEAGLSRHFPVRVKTISVLEKTLHAGECWDVSTRGNDWGVDNGEELYCILNVGRLVLNPGSSVIVRGNVFTLICQELVKVSAADESGLKGVDGSPSFDIGILPTPFSYASVDSCEMDGRPGLAGVDGEAARQNQSLPMTSTIFGPIHTGGSKGAINGSKGMEGETGGRGENGKVGGACKLAEINLRKIVCGKEGITILAKAGDGGTGGTGGSGGVGGRGSAGLDAYRTLYEDYHAGIGGAGGNGGDGGRGGNGGNGGISSNIYVCVPREQEEFVHLISLEGRGGVAGKGGPGGQGGEGGAGGREADMTMAGSGRNGLSGHEGPAGRTGHNRPAPPMFLNENKI